MFAFIRYVEVEYCGKAMVLSPEEMEYRCHVIPITMASVYNQRFPRHVNGFLEYDTNPVCLKQIRIENPRHMLFVGKSAEELAKAIDFFGLPFDKDKVCENS